MSAPPKTPSAKAAPLHLHEPTQEELKKEQLERHEGTNNSFMSASCARPTVVLALLHL